MNPTKVKAVIVGLLAILALSACKRSMVGDSITGMGTKEFNSLDEGENWAVGVAGRSPWNTLNPGEKSLSEAVLEAYPRIDSGGYLIIQDDGEFMDYDAQIYWMEWVRHYVPDDINIVWVAPHDFIKPQVTEQVAQAIRDNLQDDIIVEWDVAVKADPSLLTDRLHPTQHGSHLLNLMIMEATP